MFTSSLFDTIGNFLTFISPILYFFPSFLGSNRVLGPSFSWESFVFILLFEFPLKKLNSAAKDKDWRRLL